MLPQKKHTSFLSHVLKDKEHARRSLKFLVLHALHEEQEIIQMLADEMQQRGWMLPEPDEDAPQSSS